MERRDREKAQGMGGACRAEPHLVGSPDSNWPTVAKEG